MAQTKHEPEERVVSIPAGITKLYSWLAQVKDSVRTFGELAERKARAGNEVQEDITLLGCRYLRCRRGEERLKALIGTTAEKLRDLWARGLVKVDGITISPVVELSLPYQAVVTELDAETAARVIRHEPVLDVVELVRLANSDPKLRMLIQRHLRSKFTLEVKRVTVASADQ